MSGVVSAGRIPGATALGAAAAACLVVVLPVSTGAASASAATRSASSVTIRADGVDLSGVVSSPNPRCEGGRTVVLYRQVGARGGGDDPVIGTDTTSVRRGVGVWSTGNTGIEGRFWVRVVPTRRCAGAVSRAVRAVR